MAFVDAALRHGLTSDPDGLIRVMSKIQLRIGVPDHVCVTGTIQRVLQETRADERKKDRSLPFYRSTIAMREVVSYDGRLALAFDRNSCVESLVDLLMRTAAAINYFGKRGSFFQYYGCDQREKLDHSFTRPVVEMEKDEVETDESLTHEIATLDDFGPGATFDALNSFSASVMKRGVHRKFVETTIPLKVRNFGFGFTDYVMREPGPRCEGD